MSDATTLEPEVPGGETAPAQNTPPANEPAAGAPPAGGQSGAPAAAPPKSASELVGGEAPSDEPQAPADDWREKLAGKDEKLLARLRRFSSLENWAKTYRELENKLSTTRPVVLPENATEEQVAEYRQALGVPEAPDGYGIQLPEDAPERDKAVLNAVLDAAHKAHTPPGLLKPIVDTYLKERAQAAQEFVDQGKREAAETRKVLRGEWGRDFDLNARIIDRALDHYTGDRGAELANIMLANGQPLATNELFARFVASLGRDVMPAEVLEFGGGSGGKTIQEQIDEGLDLMRTDENKYWSEAHQKRMTALYEAQDKLRERGRAA